MARKIKKAKAASVRKHTVTVTVTDEELRKLKRWKAAYPDNPSMPETAHRLLEQELQLDKRG